MKVTTLGIDLAKSIFRLHGVDARGAVVLRKQLLVFQAAAGSVGDRYLAPPSCTGLPASSACRYSRTGLVEVLASRIAATVWTRRSRRASPCTKLPSTAKPSPGRRP